MYGPADEVASMNTKKTKKLVRESLKEISDKAAKGLKVRTELKAGLSATSTSPPARAFL
jgi:hypothetical protein